MTLSEGFFSDFQFNWLIHTGSARAAVIAVDLWKDLPFFAILVLSGLQFISEDIYEAARVDGANGIQCFTRITLPLVAKKCSDFVHPIYLMETDQFRPGICHDFRRPGRGHCSDRISYYHGSLYKSERRLCSHTCGYAVF